MQEYKIRFEEIAYVATNAKNDEILFLYGRYFNKKNAVSPKYLFLGIYKKIKNHFYKLPINTYF